MPISQILALSACHTGIPNIRTGSHKYITIIAGFFFAGSRNVLGKLWAVNHISAAIFMIRFYETLLREKQPPVALALKPTQEWMREAPVAELLEWIGRCRLMSEGRRQEMCYDLEGWYKPKEIPFQSPYDWAGFCVGGQSKGLKPNYEPYNHPMIGRGFAPVDSQRG